MLIERGLVSKVGRGRVVVTIQRPSSCKSCSARGACMTLGPTERKIEVLDPVGAAEGDEVEIGIPPGRVVWASTIAYIVPVAAMIGGGAAGYHLFPGADPDLAAAAGAFGALFISAFGIWVHGRLIANKEGAMPRVVRVVAAGAMAAPGVDTDPAVS